MKTLFVAVSIFLLQCSIAQAQAPYFQGKTIRIVTGYPAGDVNDLWPRLIAQYMTKYIPGNPNFIVQNMPGASSMIAANYVYGVAKPDGLTLGWISPTLYFDQIVKRKEVRYDWARYSFIGTPVQSEHQLYMRTDSPYKTIEDVRRASEAPKYGSGGAAGTGFYFPRLLEETVGANFNIILGYQGGGPIDLAVERGEIHCRAMTIESFFAREPFHTWRKTNFVKSIAQSGKKKDRRLPDTPTSYELMDKYKTPEQPRRVADVILAGGFFGRPMVGPPGIAPEQLKILRSAFASALKDPELKVGAEKQNYDLDPVGGAAMDKLAKEVMNQPPAIIERMNKVLGN
ncbi:MAG TPA: tripartite tricarboxylate transporter substrate-binding protein [Candidatus Limnocylindria bacterium]|nr:tripartite tricarboxylate transporter substrate-binding protein [Candidatus Limnocylindria bacterium]